MNQPATNILKLALGAGLCAALLGIAAVVRKPSSSSDRPAPHSAAQPTSSSGRSATTGNPGLLQSATAQGTGTVSLAANSGSARAARRAFETFLHEQQASLADGTIRLLGEADATKCSADFVFVAEKQGGRGVIGYVMTSGNINPHSFETSWSGWVLKSRFVDANDDLTKQANSLILAVAQCPTAAWIVVGQ